jgi:hypothetical protein
MDSTLQLAAEDLSDENLQKLTLELSKTLNDETEMKASLQEKASGPGSKGDPITLGTIVLTAISSGTVVALFNVIKSYIERKPSLEFEFKRKSGIQLKIKAEQLSKEQIDQTIQMANEFFGE